MGLTALVLQDKNFLPVFVKPFVLAVLPFLHAGKAFQHQAAGIVKAPDLFGDLAFHMGSQLGQVFGDLLLALAELYQFVGKQQAVLSEPVFCPGISKKAFHDLWHTAATMMLKDGVNVKIVSEVLGHARGMCCPACRRRSETGVDEV